MPKVRACALIVHGGAGMMGPPHERAARKRTMISAVKAGAEILRSGGSALDAVVASVVVLEDDVLFNAGYGSLLNNDGAVEMDASVMIATPSEKRNREPVVKAGAVGAVSRIKNPVTLARAIMEQTNHILMVGGGAERFARTVGIKLCNPEELISERARQRWRVRMERERLATVAREKHGTVGATAIDIRGQLAAATSTGGVPGKMVGRVGDSAIIGAGTYADARAAASATGHGEAIILASLCRETIDELDRSAPTRAATRKIAELIAPHRSEAGIILVDRNARVAYAHNAETMEVGIFHSQRGISHAWAKPMATSRKPRR